MSDLLSDHVFAAGWTVLQDRFGRAFSTQTTKIYREILSAELTDIAFQTACRAAFRFETYFPSPQKLIDLATGKDFEALALAEWDACLTRARSGEMATLPNTSARTLMNSATNGVPLGSVAADRLDWIKREFVKRYAAQLATEAQQRTPAVLPTVRKELAYVAAD